MLMAVLNAANTSASSSAPRNLIQTWKRAVDSHALANDVKNHVFKDSTNPSSPEPERITGGVETKDGKVKKVWLTSSGPDTLYLPQEKVDEINSQ